MDKIINEDEYYADNNIYEMDVKDLLRDGYTYSNLEFSINNYMGDDDYKKIAMFHDASFNENLMDKATFEIWRDSPEGVGSCGQLMPIVVYRDLIVDGRNRMRALLSLGVEKIKYRKLKNNLTKREVEKWVLMNNNRKQLTKTQQALNLYINKRCDKKTKVERSKVGKSTGGRVSPSQLERVHSLVLEIGIKDPRIESLRQGGAYKKLNGKLTISLQAIVDDLRIRSQKEIDEIVAAGNDPDGYNRTTKEYKKMRKILSGILFDEYLSESEKLAIRDTIADADIYSLADYKKFGEAVDKMYCSE